MLTFRVLPTSAKCWPCKLAHCKCEKCRKLRSEENPNPETLASDEKAVCSKLISGDVLKAKANDKINKTIDTSVHTMTTPFKGLKNVAIGKFFPFPSLTRPAFNFTPSNLQSLIFDIVGVISFFIMATIMFWVTVSQYLWQFIKILLQSGRKVQLTALVLLLLLCLSITFHAFKGSRHRYQQNIQTAKSPSSDILQPQSEKQPEECSHYKSCQHKRCFHFNLQKPIKNLKKSNVNILTAIQKQTENCERNCVQPPGSKLTNTRIPSLCDLSASILKSESSTQTSLTDEEVLEMYKRYKLYSVPIEMKTPPSIGNIIEILSAFFNGLRPTDSAINTEN